MNEENGFRVDRYYTTTTAPPPIWEPVTVSPGYITGTTTNTNTTFYPTSTVVSGEIEFDINRWALIGEVDGRKVRVSPQGMWYVEEDEIQNDFEPIEEEEFEKALKELLE